MLQKLTDLLGAQGRAMRVSVTNTGYAVRVLGASLTRVVPDLHHRRGFLRDQLIVCGLTPLPVVCVVGMFTGMILALQIGVALEQYGQAEQLSSIIGVILFREMGPVMTGMILTASVGSAMAAEIGTMSVSEEIDGLECLSIDINSFLAMPRIVALTIMAPILVFIGCVLGIMGGALVSLTQLSVPLDIYYRNVRESLTADPGFGGFPEEIYTGLIKSAVFGMLIATISCAAGMQAHGGALGVGRAVRSAVIRSFLMIIVFGYFISWLFFR